MTPPPPLVRCVRLVHVTTFAPERAARPRKSPKETSGDRLCVNGDRDWGTTPIRIAAGPMLVTSSISSHATSENPPRDWYHATLSRPSSSTAELGFQAWPQ